MFIEQSVGRRRVVRLLFLVAGLVPCGGLVAAAWWRHSAGHAAAVESQIAAHLGVPLSIGAVTHPRPGAMRLSRVVVRGPAGDEELRVAELDVEMSEAEVRVRVPRIECSARAARLLEDVVREWLRRPARFPKSWIVDAAEVAYLPADGAPPLGVGAWHVECVVAGDARAVRLRREPASATEIRVRWSGGELSVEGAIGEAIPASIVAALVDGAEPWADSLGPHAMVEGAVDATRGTDGWTGSLEGTLQRLDLAAVCGAVRRVRGEATLAFAPLRFAAGRIVDCDLRLSAAGGVVSQDVLDALVGGLGCRPGPAYRALGGDPLRPFDEIACRVLLDAAGLRVRSVEGAGGALVTARGLSMIEEPATAVPASRLAWFLSPAGRPAVPASPASAWLISVLPESGGF